MEPSTVRANRLDQVPFHDLHVIQIEEQLDVWTRDFFAYLDGPFRVVTHVPRVVTFAVQRFKADSDPMIRGDVLTGMTGKDHFHNLALSRRERADPLGRVPSPVVTVRDAGVPRQADGGFRRNVVPSLVTLSISEPIKRWLFGDRVRSTDLAPYDQDWPEHSPKQRIRGSRNLSDLHRKH